MPAYLLGGGGSPPRSPHVAPPGIFEQYFQTSTSNTRQPSFRPTRRDVLLCLLTLSFSYLLFTAPESTGSTALPFGSNGRSRGGSSSSSSGAGGNDSGGYFGKWSFFSQSDSCAAGSEGRSESTFGESVQPHGLIKSSSRGSSGQRLDVVVAVSEDEQDAAAYLEQSDWEGSRG